MAFLVTVFGYFATIFTPPFGTNFSICSLILLPCVPIYSIHIGSAGIFYLLSIDYAFQPHLRSRLTLGGRTFPRKPWVFGGTDSHCALATYSSILSCVQSTTPFGMTSSRTQRSSTTCIPLYTNPKLRYIV